MSAMPGRGLERFAWLSIAAALLTMAIKTLAWWVTGSVGLLSDAMESLVNLGAAILTLSMLRIAAAPPDRDHPHGHDKAQYFASGIEGGLIVLAAAAIIFAALPRIWAPQPLGAPLLGIVISTAASGINLAVALALIRASRRHDSIALEADGRHLLTDVWTSAGVIVGVILVAVTGVLVLDPLIALAVAAHIVWTGVQLMRRSVSGLMDVRIPADELAEVEKILAEYVRRYGVAFHALRTRRAGARRFVSFHLLVPDEWSVAHAHRLSEEIESRIGSLVPNASLLVHIEPIGHQASYDDMPLDR
ncbi:MAG: cation diffusion facilitator family transporter [Burkholderiales bacterium]